MAHLCSFEPAEWSWGFFSEPQHQDQTPRGISIANGDCGALRGCERGCSLPVTWLRSQGLVSSTFLSQRKGSWIWCVPSVDTPWTTSSKWWSFPMGPGNDTMNSIFSAKPGKWTHSDITLQAKRSLPNCPGGLSATCLSKRSGIKWYHRRRNYSPFVTNTSSSVAGTVR